MEVNLNFTKEWHEKALELREKGFSQRKISKKLNVPKTTLQNFFAKTDEVIIEGKGPKVLILDIETSPIFGAVWRLFKQNVGLNQIEKEWYMLSYCAKWYGEDIVTYQDKSESWDTEDDSDLLESLWVLLDEADFVIAHNGIGFDVKKINARFILNGMQPPSSYKVIDTLNIAKNRFGFTSNRLAWLTDKLCVQYKKLDHGKFAGYDLWKECLKGNPEAWLEMQEYNINDVLSLEELYNILRPWDTKHPNINLYYDDTRTRCRCGSHDLIHNGFAYTNLSKFDRFRCTDCGAEVRGRVNLLPKEKRLTLKMNIPGV